ncbi:MAG: hypothetical protein K2Q26_05890 [Bdellovibrionales bacterium]|nr:hypothetical protein [Bdellovibrionales bacterium]
MGQFRISFGEPIALLKVSVTLAAMLGKLFFILVLGLLVGCSSDENTGAPSGIVHGGGESSGGGGSPLKANPQVVQAYLDDIQKTFTSEAESDPKLRLMFYRSFRRLSELPLKPGNSQFYKEKFSSGGAQDPFGVFRSFYSKITSNELSVVGNDSFSIYQQINLYPLREKLKSVKWVYGDCAKIHQLPAHTHASFMTNQDGSVLCFDVAKLSDLGVDHFQNQIMALFLHEIGHMYEFSEDECITLQKMFSWHFDEEQASSIHQVRFFDILNKVEINSEKWCSVSNFVQIFSDKNLARLYENLINYPIGVQAAVSKGDQLEEEVVYLLNLIESFILDTNKFKQTFCGAEKNQAFAAVHTHIIQLQQFLLGTN